MPAASKHYWAFLSYSSKDEKIARRFRSALENYRIPKDLVGKQTRDGDPIPHRLFPIFRDRDELPLSSDLGGSIEDALRSSRYLIVLCSPRAAASRWVNEEVRLFKSMGGENRILAIILSGRPNASEETAAEGLECFPAALTHRVNEDGTLSDERSEPIAGDLRPNGDGWTACLLKSVAGITGVSLAAFTKRETVRTRWRRGMAVVCALLFSLLTGAWWDYTRIKTSRYAQISERFGMPVGVAELDATSAARRYRFYIVESSRGKVRTVSFRNGCGTVEEDTEAPFGAGMRELIYREDGSPQGIVFKNRGGRVLVRHLFGELTPGIQGMMERTIKIEGPSGAAKPLEADSGSFAPSTDPGELRVHSEISAWRVHYDARGHMVRLLYLNTYHLPRSDAHGAFGKAFKTDPDGLILEQTLLGENGVPCPDNNGVQTLLHTRDSGGNITSEAFFDHEGNPVLGGTDYHRTIYVQDNDGRCIELSYFGIDGSPVLASDCLSHRIQMFYDDRGNLREQRWLDTLGNLAPNNNRVSTALSDYDSKGALVAISYFGPSQQPILNSNARHKETFCFDERGNINGAFFFGTDGTPILDSTGVAGWKTKFDEHGNEIHVAFFGTDGKPILMKDPVAGWASKFDERGNKIECRFFGIDGKPALDTSGSAGWAKKFDERGNEIHTTLLGINDQPILNRYGIAGWFNSFDERGNRTETAYFGIDGKPILDTFGIAGWNSKFDTFGNEIEQAYFGTDRKLILNKQGTAGWISKYDPRGNRTEHAFFGIAREPTSDPNGIARIAARFDDRGNRIEQAFFGIDGKPVLSKNGFSILKTNFDSRGKELESRRYDTSGEPVANVLGYHLEARAYDSRSNLVWEEWWDPSGKRTLHAKTGVAGRELTYNARGDLIETRLFGVDVQPMDGKQGWAREVIEFDEQTGQPGKRTRFKADGTLLK